MDDNNSLKADWVRSALREHEGPLTRYAAQITGDADKARDVVQDTFVRLWAEDPARLNGRLTEWLYTVCRNRAIDLRRKEKRMTPLTDVELETRESVEPSPSIVVERRESAGQILRLLDALPPNQREVVRLKFQNDLSYQEISNITKLSVSNVGFLLHTALKTLREQMKADAARNQ